MNAGRPLYKDPDYVQGHITALYQLVLALAQILPKEEFRLLALTHLEAARIAILEEPVAETRFLALEHAEKWVMAATK